jgi:tetratricopeptide (TPR) repeat protein
MNTSRPLAILLLAACLPACSDWHWPKPADSLDLYLKGQLDAESGKLDDALSSLSAAIDKNPNLGLAFVARGDVYEKKGDYEKAATDFHRASVLEPFNFSANYKFGLMSQYLKRFTDAIAAYQKAVEIRPLDPNANMNLAMVYTQMGEPLKGLPYAQRAVQGATDSATTNANLGILYAQIGYNDNAIASLKRSIELNSRQPEVYINLGQEYLKAQHYEQARNVLETAQDIAPSPVVSERLGYACYKLKDFKKAREAFHDALRLSADYIPALNGLGVVAMTESIASTPPDLDAAREALGYWDRSLKLNPDQPAIQKLVQKYTGTK